MVRMARAAQRAADRQRVPQELIGERRPELAAVEPDPRPHLDAVKDEHRAGGLRRPDRGGDGETERVRPVGRPQRLLRPVLEVELVQRVADLPGLEGR